MQPGDGYLQPGKIPFWLQITIPWTPNPDFIPPGSNPWLWTRGFPSPQALIPGYFLVPTRLLPGFRSGLGGPLIGFADLVGITGRVVLAGYKPTQLALGRVP